MLGPDETLIWEGRPSVWGNPSFGMALGACIVLIGIPWTLWLYLGARCTQYQLTSERFIWKRGVLSRRSDQVELYRVRDVSLVEPWWLRPMGLGHVGVWSSDLSTEAAEQSASKPVEWLRAIPEAEAVQEAFRSAVESVRNRKGIRALDVEVTR